MKNETWTLTDLPVDRKGITGRWVYKLKEDKMELSLSTRHDGLYIGINNKKN